MVSTRRRWGPTLLTHRRGRVAVAGATSIVLTTVMFATVAGATPSSFLELDGNVLSATNTNHVGGPYDWANGGTLSTTNGTVSVSGGGGVFNGGVFNGATTPPTAPSETATAASDPNIADAEFKVDPLSVDHTACGSGDPTVYTGAGSETNGDLLTSDTFGTGSVPNKDDLSNVYALAHIDASTNEVFFGAERVINNGDSHIDFEFLQGAAGINSGCSGTFFGDRTQGDFLLSVDFTTGGTLGGTTLYMWHCVAESSTQPAVGTKCNPPAHGKSIPHYQSVSESAVTITVNSGSTAISCGGWACRNPDGTQATTLAQNELMEGGIDLKQLGFTGCVSTFLPHTRSSQSFTATLKDFEVIPFNTCAHPTVGTTVVPAGPILAGASAHDTAQINGATANAGGTITYKLYSDSTCTTLVSDLTPTTNTVVNGVAPDSKSFVFNTPGTYYFYAEYSGDSRNIGPVNSGCAAEPLVVQPYTPSVATTIVPAQPAGGASIPTTAHDTAQISNASPDAGGTITYKLFSDNSCTTQLADLTPTVNTVVNGVAPASKDFTFQHAGTYYFYAVYSGDTKNTGPVNSGCSAEPFTVKPNTPAVGTTVVPSGPINIGDSAHDTAQITGATAAAGGTITYALYSDSTCTTQLADLTPTVNTVVNGVAPDSKSYQFTSAGTYYFYAVYSGDSDNTGPVNSGCASEPLVVNPNTPAPHSTPVVQIKDTLTVGGLSSNATGSVVVGLYSDSGCTTQIGTNSTFPVSGAVNGTLTAQTSFVGALSGSYWYKISYAGDGNNVGFSSCDESVGVAITSLP